MPCIYNVYTLHILVYTIHITFTSCFQGFVALIAHTRRPIRIQGTTCQTYTMRLILISPIHKQCWKDSCPKCPVYELNKICYVYELNMKIGATSKDRNSPRMPKFQYFLRIGCALSFSAGNDEPERFASACVVEFPLLQIYFSILMYMI